MLLRSADLASIQRYCRHNRPLLERSHRAGCFACGATFAPTDVHEFTRDEDALADDGADETARCPECGAGAVLPSAAPVMIDERTLAALQRYWFSGQA